jgi:hypothetical protein
MSGPKIESHDADACQFPNHGHFLGARCHFGRVNTVQAIKLTLYN